MIGAPTDTHTHTHKTKKILSHSTPIEWASASAPLWRPVRGDSNRATRVRRRDVHHPSVAAHREQQIIDRRHTQKKSKAKGKSKRPAGSQWPVAVSVSTASSSRQEQDTHRRRRNNRRRRRRRRHWRRGGGAGVGGGGPRSLVGGGGGGGGGGWRKNWEIGKKKPTTDAASGDGRAATPSGSEKRSDGTGVGRAGTNHRRPPTGPPFARAI